MESDKNIFFLTADFGAPALDVMRRQLKDRCINVGIAEQNMISIAAGLALEGFTVFAYAIAPFLTMRAFEQIRNHLSLQHQLRPLNVNLIGVGAGLSYDLSGPSHHCLEDLALMRILPHIMVLSPSDTVLAEQMVDVCFSIDAPKYLRLDAKPLPPLRDKHATIDLSKGYTVLTEGTSVLLVTTGYMTQIALKACDQLKTEDINPGVIDVFSLQPLDEQALAMDLKKYEQIVVAEEAFKDRGGLGDMVRAIACNDLSRPVIITLGFSREHLFQSGDRNLLLGLKGLNAADLAQTVRELKDRYRSCS